MLSVDKGLDPLLKRPFSIHRLVDEDFQLLYRVVGKGTYILSKKTPGDILDVIGPLGNGFPVNKTQNNIILVAGGLGMAPIFALAETLAKLSKTKKRKNVILPFSPLKKKGETMTLEKVKSGGNFKLLLFYGVQTKKEALCIDKLRSIGIVPIISTDDGTFGKKGNVIQLLKNFLSLHALPVTRYVLYACGPKPMLKSLSAFAKKNKIKGYITLEENMACGLGTCLGCVVNTTKGFQSVCKEGPVFSIDEIIW